MMNRLLIARPPEIVEEEKGGGGEGAPDIDSDGWESLDITEGIDENEGPSAHLHGKPSKFRCEHSKKLK